MYAVVKTGGKQYKVSEGEIVRVDKLPYNENDEIVLTDVLLVVKDGAVKAGTPLVSGAKVKATVTSHCKGDKLISFKYTSKTGFHKKKGHRQQYTELTINKIEA